MKTRLIRLPSTILSFYEKKAKTMGLSYRYLIIQRLIEPIIEGEVNSEIDSSCLNLLDEEQKKEEKRKEVETKPYRTAPQNKRGDNNE